MTSSADAGSDEIRNAFRRIVMVGLAPNGVAADTREPFAEEYHALVDAYETGGVEGARRTFAALAQNNPGLAELVAADSSPARHRFEVHRAAEALLPQPERNWVIEGLMGAGDVAIIIGEPGSKKTYTALDCGVCVAQGKDWLGFTTRQCQVLVIDEESGLERLNRRLGQLMRAHDALASLSLAYITLETLNLRVEADADALDALVSEVGARLVIIDALADVMLGGNENDVGDVQPVFHRLRTIASKRQCAIVVIHHVNKGGGYRGSSSIKGAVDLMLRVESEPSSQLIQITAEKCRDDMPPKFAAQIDFNGDTVVITEAVVEATPVKFGKPQQYVLRYLRDHGPSLLQVIEGSADICSSSSARDAVYALTAVGHTARVDAGGQGSAATYDLTTNGREAAQHV